MGLRGPKSKVKRIYNEQGILIKKECTQCKRILPVECFAKESKAYDKLKAKCKNCKNGNAAIKKESNKDKVIKEFKACEYEVKDKHYGIIYVVLNLYSRKHYIGQTKNTFDERYPYGWLEFHKHKESVKEDLEKYGENSFIYIKLYDIAYSKQHLDALEVYYINKFDAYNNGYNDTRGNYK